MKKQLVSYMKKYFSTYMSPDRKGYSTQHIHIRLSEGWRNKLDNDLFVGSVLMDLSKVFDCIPHNLIIAKMAVYGVQNESLSLLFPYLTNRKRCAKINNTYSTFKEIISGTLQESVLGTLFFNPSSKDLFFFIEAALLHNFAEGNTLSAWAQPILRLVSKLKIACKNVMN